jgi:4-amino-4-deoxy-L-arabinose transferase-like glycosyltransferase
MALALVPVLAWLAAALLIFNRSGPSRTLRESLLVAVVLAGAWLVLGTELLSLGHALSVGPVLLWWAIPALALGIGLRRRYRDWRSWLPKPPRLAAAEYALLATLTWLLGWCWCQAAFAPPNNIDSVSYHLPRQVFWIQQASVENYPTSSLRQIAMPPLTEFAGLHLMLLTGSDRLHNLVQWCALGLTLCAVSVITRRFGGTLRAQLLSALWVATIPIAFMQASNTKNDVVVAMWTCLLALWILPLGLEPTLRWSRVLLIGLSVGALTLTKGTGMIFGLPIAGLSYLLLLRRHGPRAIPALALIPAVTLALNAGALLRNYQAFGTPLPNDPAIHGGDSVVNQDRSGAALLSNVVRNIAPHLTTPSQAWNERLTRLVLYLHGWLGRDVDDPRTTWRESGFRPYSYTQKAEDAAASPVHLLVLVLLPVFLVHCPQEARRAALMLLLVLLTGFLLFCLVLKWQVWHVRLTVALAALAAPIFAWVSTVRPASRLAPLAGLALVVGLLPSLNFPQRPLLGPLSILAADSDAVRWYPATDRGRTMAKQAERMNQLQPRIVGISSGWSFPDYLLQRALLDRMAPPPTFGAFNAALQVPGKPEPDPDVLLVADSGPDRIRHSSTGTWYVKQERLRPYDLFVKEAELGGSRR